MIKRFDNFFTEKDENKVIKPSIISVDEFIRVIEENKLYTAEYFSSLHLPVSNNLFFIYIDDKIYIFNQEDKDMILIELISRELSNSVDFMSRLTTKEFNLTNPQNHV